MSKGQEALTCLVYLGLGIFVAAFWIAAFVEIF